MRHLGQKAAHGALYVAVILQMVSYINEGHIKVNRLFGRG